MILNTAIAESPGRCALCGFSDEPVLHFQPVIQKFLIVVYGSKLIVETIVLVVAYAEDGILYPKGISEVFSNRKTCYLDFPVIEVFAIEQADPFPLGLVTSVVSNFIGDQNNQQRAK